jgi:hypothetical protein
MGAPSGGLQSPVPSRGWLPLANLQAPSAGGGHRGSLRGSGGLVGSLGGDGEAGTRAPVGGLQSRGLPLASTVCQSICFQ